MKQYLDLLEEIVKTGETRGDRTGTGTRSVFGRQLRFNLQEGFPLLTTKRMFMKGITHELLWFLMGETNIQYLLDNDVHIWDGWATAEGEIGKLYGSQWVDWNSNLGIPFRWVNQYGINQIEDVIQSIKKNPSSRRHVVSAWNVDFLPDESISPQDNVRNGKMALAPCHVLFQFYVSQKKELSCHLYMRSSDFFLGTPFNIASYSLLTHMIAQQCDLEVGDFIFSTGDTHIYNDHLTDDIVYEQLRREPRPLPKLIIKRKPESIFSYKFEDFEIVGYECHPHIKAPVAI
jgi:thymidylate synthase